MTRRQLIVGAVVALGGSAVVALLGVGTTVWLMLRRSLLPRSIAQPSSVARIGRLSDFVVGVNTDFLQAYRHLCRAQH